MKGIKAIRSSIREVALSQLSTKELVDELKKREGVETHMVGPSAVVHVTADGPAIVLVVID